MMPNLAPWILATRPKTLAAGLVPVGLATSMAAASGFVDGGLSLLCLACSLLIQIITNFINEIEDFKRGADTDRVGPQRMVASGVIRPAAMRKVTVVLVALTLFLGSFLVSHSGPVVLVIGLVSLLFAYCYTGGPYPLAYKGLADVFVLIFFGLIAVNGTYFVLTGTFSLVAFFLSFGTGLLSMNILGVNNIRDLEGDKRVGKNTLAVRLGRSNAIWLYVGLNLLAFLSNFAAYLVFPKGTVLLPLLLFPFSLLLIQELRSQSGPALNAVLAKTSGLLLVYGIVTSASFLFS
jgi:1,4-dihydroxy-2-naphthoate octaprenyltransferase